MNGISRENMKILILTASVFLSLVSTATVNPPPRSVNVALETSFLFEPKDINDNISFIKNIKVFLDKLYNILAPQASDAHQFRAKPTRKYSFVDFIKNAGDSFLKFKDEKIQNIVKSLDVQVVKVANRSKLALRNFVPNKDIKEYIQRSVKQWAQTDAGVLKNNLKKLINENNPLLQNFGRRMNNYYNEDDVIKLNKFLKKLSTVDTIMDQSQTIKEALHFAILEKYKNLNYTSRVNLVNDMKLLAEYMMEKKKNTMDRHNKVPTIMKRTFQYSELSGKEKENVLGEPKDSIEKDEMYNELKKTIGNKLQLASEKIYDNKEDPINNEIIVDNVELFLQPSK